MLFFELEKSSHSPKSSRKNLTSPEIVYPLNEYYFYHISDINVFSHLNLVFGGLYRLYKIPTKIVIIVSQQIVIYNITRIFQIFH